MKVLLVIDSLGSGGAQRQIVNLAIGLSRKGTAVELIYYHKNEFYLSKLIENNITVHRPTKFIKGFSIQFATKLRNLIKQNFDSVISFLFTPSIYTSISRFGIRNCKHIVCERSSSKSNNRSFIQLNLFYISMLFSNKVVTNSYSETENIKKLFNLSNKTYTIWNGYETNINKINFKTKTYKTLLVIGRITYEKNGINLMRALSLFLDRNGWCPKIKWAGRRDHNINLVKISDEMDKYLLDNKLINKYWNWLGEVTNIDELFDQSDALILPSLWEGLPNVICESMLKGCNVLASNVCDNPKLLKNGEHGLLFDPYSPLDICLAIENYYKLSDNHKLIMAKKAFSYAQNKLSINKMVESYNELIKS